MEINEKNIKEAFAVADDNQKKILEALFGKQEEEKKPITERIKTLDDALAEVTRCEYKGFESSSDNESGFDDEYGDLPHDVYALLKLRAISAALNEGWNTKENTGDTRHFPYFTFINNFCSNAIRDLEENGGGNCAKVKGGYIVFGGVFSRESNTCYYENSAISYKNMELAVYAGSHFAKEYAEMFGYELEK